MDDEDSPWYWRPEDSAAASAEGWDLFEAERDGEMLYEIERDDDMAVFPHDDAAWSHVHGMAAAGGSLHLRALVILAMTYPAEFQRVTSTPAVPADAVMISKFQALLAGTGVAPTSTVD